jgi:hypothetical protein
LPRPTQEEAVRTRTQRRQPQRLNDVSDARYRPPEDVYEKAEIERVGIETARPTSRSVGGGARIDDEWDGQVERVGGPRRFRGEILLLVAGLLFLGGALLKPWPAPAPVKHPSPDPTSQPVVIAAVPAATPTAAPTAVQYALVPPYNYRWPFVFPGPTSAPADQAAGSQSVSWTKVDWSALKIEDNHAGWGFAAAVMSGGPSGLASASAPSPSTSWVTLGSPPVYSAVPIVQTQGVYAVALTWPTEVQVSDVSFTYLGGPQHPAYLPPPSFLPGSPVTPLPAAVVFSTARAGVGSGRSIRSGEFLIPPTSAASKATSHSLLAAWRSNPWPWPYGAYQVTVTSSTKTMRFVLELLLTG